MERNASTLEESMLGFPSISKMRVALFVDKDAVKYEKAAVYGNTVTTSKYQYPAFDFLEMLGGATREVSVRVVIPGYGEKHPRIRCHDLGFPFSASRYFDFVIYDDQGNVHNARMGFALASQSFTPVCHYTFRSRKEDVEKMKRIFIDLLSSSGVNLARFGKQEMEQFSKFSVNRAFKRAVMISDGVFVIIGRSDESRYYAEAFDAVMSGGKCSIKRREKMRDGNANGDE